LARAKQRAGQALDAPRALTQSGAMQPDPIAAGFDPDRLAEAAAFALAHETPWPRDVPAHLVGGHFEPPPHNELLGPVLPRGAPNGLVLRHGRLAVRWGHTRQTDMTFSVAKSYLSLLAGIAVGDGRLALDEPVASRVAHPVFAGERHTRITWRHLLTLTSEWEGELFGKSEAIDRGRDLAAEGRKSMSRALGDPGSHFEYNDVRVNLLSLALTLLFRRPLPAVFAERIMRPLGSSAGWAWHGYRTSWIAIEGTQVQVVPGGGHWGGGVLIHAEDQALIGELARHDPRGLLPPGWMAQSTTPSARNPSYGFLWWLNAERRWPSATPGSFCASGAGGHTTWIAPEHGITAVFRWLDPAALDPLMGRVLAALR
jgi:CubicO group peptidase (beta-lactamase class C family)